MSEHDRGPFEVPVERLAAGRGSSIRARFAAVAGVAVIGGAIGLSVVSRTESEATARIAQGGDRSPNAASTGPSATTPPQVEPAIRAENVPLAGSPSVDLVFAEGRDLVLERWVPGAGLRPVGRFTGALTELPDAVEFPILAPDERHAVILRFGPGGPAPTPARLLDRAGRVLWEDDAVAAFGGAAWSQDSRTFVAPGPSRSWNIVTIDDDGGATERSVSLVLSAFTPSPEPNGQLSPPGEEPVPVPVGFSVDGDWIYGAWVAPEVGGLGETFRVARDGAAIEWRPLGVGRPDGLDASSGPAGLVDPGTGRTAVLARGSDPSRRATVIEVRDADRGLAFVVDDGGPLGAAWDDDGTLFVLSGDIPMLPNRVVLRPVAPDGVLGESILESGPVRRASMIGIVEGYAIIALAGKPPLATHLVMVDVKDPSRITALGMRDDPFRALRATIVAPRGESR